MDNFFQNRIAKNVIDDEAIRWAFIEMGSGPCVQFALSNIAGSSNTLLEGKFPNSKEAQVAMGKPENIRSVSLEAVRDILHYTKNQSPEMPTVFVSSWQIPSGDKKVDTHGWIGLKQGENEYYFHLTLTELVENTRSRAQELIAQAGIAILQSKGRLVPGFHGIDISLWDTLGNHAIDQFAQIEIAENCSPDVDHIVCFDENGRWIRALDMCRSASTICLFKGSFNPVTIGHLEMARAYEAQTGQKPVFAISANTIDKWFIRSEDLQRRITLISNLGYSVVVLRHGKFVDNVTTLRKLGFWGDIQFLCGADTKNRLKSEDIEFFEEQGVRVFFAERVGHKSPETHRVFSDIEWNPIDCSSTHIRDRGEWWESLIPKQNLKLYKGMFV